MTLPSQIYVLELAGRPAAKVYRDRGVFTVDAYGLSFSEVDELMCLVEEAQADDKATAREAA